MSNGTVELTIVGNLTADPEVRTVGSGASVANFTIASTPRTFNKNTNQWEDGPALFMRCAAWRELADNVSASLHKGMRVITSGRLSQRSYQAKDGSNRTVYEMTVDEIGPSLRYATAQVEHVQKANGFNQQQGYSQSGRLQTAQRPPQQATQSASDPWGSNPDPYAAQDFGRHDDNPEF